MHQCKLTFRLRASAACLMAAGALLAGCGKSNEKAGAAGEQEPVTPVMVETAVRGAIDHVVTADAVLYPINQSNVTSKISAPVKRVLVNRGDHVRAGQPLLELESGDLAATAEETKHQYEQAQASYQNTSGATVPEDRTKAQADMQAAQQALETAKKLYENRVALEREGALAQKLVDDAKVAMVQAQSQFETVQRHLEALNQVGQRETIRSAEAQMKLGWIAAGGPGHEEALQKLDWIADTYLSVGTPVQAALPRLLEIAESVQTQIRERTAANLSWLAAQTAGSAANPLRVEGGWYAVLQVPRTRTEEQWVLGLLRDCDVLVQPGFFYDFESEAFLVLSLLSETAIFREGLRRLLAIL